MTGVLPLRAAGASLVEDVSAVSTHNRQKWRKHASSELEQHLLPEKLKTLEAAKRRGSFRQVFGDFDRPLVVDRQELGTFWKQVTDRSPMTSPGDAVSARL